MIVKDYIFLFKQFINFIFIIFICLFITFLSFECHIFRNFCILVRTFRLFCSCTKNEINMTVTIDCSVCVIWVSVYRPCGVHGAATRLPTCMLVCGHSRAHILIPSVQMPDDVLFLCIYDVQCWLFL